jgi:hypothetical protein
MSGKRKDVNKVLKDARKRGLVVTPAGSGHWKVTNPATGARATLSASPNTDRGVRAGARDIERLTRESA